MLKLLDFLLTLLHTLLILFNLFGWAHRRTRKWNLLALVLTGGSWSALGLFYGMGYCPLTDWHFRVLEKLGHHDLPHSYTGFLAERLTGLHFNDDLVDRLTLLFYFLALALSLFFNIRDAGIRKKAGRTAATAGEHF